MLSQNDIDRINAELHENEFSEEIALVEDVHPLDLDEEHFISVTA